MTCSTNGGFKTPYLDAYVFLHIYDLSFCAYQVFLVELFEALSQHSSLHSLTIDFDCAIESSGHLPFLYTCTSPVLPAEAVKTSLLPALKMLHSDVMNVSGLFLHSQPLTCSCESFHVVYLDKSH